MGGELNRKLDDFPRGNIQGEFEVPEFWRKLFSDYEREDFRDKPDSFNEFSEALESFQELDQEDELRVDVFPVDELLSVLENYRILLKDSLKKAKEAFDENFTPLNGEKYQFAKARYSYFIYVVMEEFVPAYNRYSKLLKSGLDKIDGFTLTDLETQIYEFSSLALDLNPEFKELFLKIANSYFASKKALIEERATNFFLLEELQKLEEKIRDLSKNIASGVSRALSQVEDVQILEVEDRILFEDVSFENTEVLEYKKKIEELTQKLNSLHLELALFDESSRLSAQEFDELRRKAKKGEEAEKRLAFELNEIDKIMQDYFRLQSEFNELIERESSSYDQIESLKEQLAQKELEIESYKQFGNSGVSQEDLIKSQSEVRDLRFKVSDQERHIRDLSSQLAELERLRFIDIIDQMRDISRKLGGLSFDVSKIKAVIFSGDEYGTPKDGYDPLPEEE